jgi:large subunit ribosomal protein L1
MAKTKQALLNEADKLGLELSVKNTIAEIEAAIDEAKAAADKTATTLATETPRTTDPKSADDNASDSETFAKAGKRSAKSQTEAAEKVAKEERKAAHDTTPQGDAVTSDQRGPKPVARPKIDRRGKNYRAAAAKFDTTKLYPLSEALKLATETATTKFDSTVEIHVRLGVDPRQADQNIRGTVSLPNGTGKTVRVAAFVPDDDVAAATAAGADVAGEVAITKLLDKETLTFDVLIATPSAMPKLGKYARLLGPRGLMPNPKADTVSTNPAQAVKEAKTGKVEYRVDKQGIVHLGVGKVSFGAAKLEQNARVFLSSLTAAKPSSLKGSYILSIAVSTTMGPGVKVENA